MKKIALTLLLACLRWQAVAQKSANPRVTIYGDAGYTQRLYEVVASVPANTYPATTAGRIAMQNAIQAGRYLLTLDNGATIPAGTVPPRTAPTVDPTNPTNPTDPTTPTPPAVKNMVRGAIIGNSISSHTANTVIGWNRDCGMAASDTNHDYAHLLLAAIAAENPNFQLAILGNGSALEQVYNSSDTQAVKNTVTNLLNDLRLAIGEGPLDFIYLSMSENFDANSFNAEQCRAMYDYLIDQLPKAGNVTIMMRNSFWTSNAPSDMFIESYAPEKNALFVDLKPLRNRPELTAVSEFGNTTVGEHPNDAGMQAIFERTWARLNGGSTGTVIPTIRGGWAEADSIDKLLALCPFVPSNNQISLWAPNTEQTIENDQIIVGIRNSIGGIVTRTVDRRYTRNLINTNSFPGPRGNYGTEDTGRSEDFSLYAHPNGSNIHPFIIGNSNSSIDSGGDDTGKNPVPGGSRHLERSPILFFERRKVNGVDVLYVQTRPYHWSNKGQLSETIRHAFHWLDGNIHHWIYIYELKWTDTQRVWEGRQQEGPFSYAIGDLWHQYVSFADDGIAPTEITKPYPYERNPIDTGDKATTGYWVGAYDDNQRGYALIAEYCAQMGGKQVNVRSGDEFSNESGYICVRTHMDADTNTCFLVQGKKHVGTLPELQSYLRANPVQRRPFQFNFAGGLFQGWSSINGPLQRINGKMVFGLGKPDGYDPNHYNAEKMLSPWGSWPASELATIYVNAAIKGTNQLTVYWICSGQSETDASNNGQYKNFRLTGDGSYRTHILSMAGTPGWAGRIAQVALQNPIGYQVNKTEEITFEWISNENQRPA